MVIGVVDDLGIGQSVPRHDRGVPVAGPAFVHDLGHPLRGKVVGLVPDDGQDVMLPVAQRSVLQQKQHHVALGLFGEPSLGGASHVDLATLFVLRMQDLGRVDVRVHVLLGCEPPAGPLKSVFVLLLLLLSLGALFGDAFRIGPTPDMDRMRVDQVFN